MAEQETTAQPTIVLETQNGSSTAARVVVPEGADASTLTLTLLTALARERGVEMTSAAERHLASVIGRYKAGGGAINEVFIRATPAVHGEPGRIEWCPGFNPEDPGGAKGEPGEDPVDFYSHSSFVKVRKEDHIATIHSPTDGNDGRDVTGRTLAANPGKPFSATLDASVLQLGDGRVLAQMDGLLCFDGRKIWVDPVLDIKGTVDFSTGNIDFDGDVVIHRDIRDRFAVKATGNVTIEGLIDASHIDCAGNLAARRGVAGRDEGTLVVGGDAHIAYIDHASGKIGGSLEITREIMHSSISVGGDLTGDRGAVIGGRVSVQGNARVADLGAPSDTPTEFRLGAPPPGGSPEGIANGTLRTLQRNIADMEREVEALRATAGPGNPKAAERVTELTFEISDAKAQLRQIAEKHPELTALAEAGPCRSTLEVLRSVHGRVTLVIGDHTVEFSNEVKGPFRVWLEGGTVMYQTGDATPHPIRDLNGVTDRAAA